MEEYFSWWNLPLDFLFDFWKVNSTTTLLFTAIAIFSIAVLFEGLRYAVVALHQKFYVLPLVPVPTCGEDNDSESSVINSILVTDSINHVKKQRIKNHCLQSLIHALNVSLSYGLMLAAMSYNGYIFIALLAGASVGYFVFCYKIHIVVPKKCSANVSKATTCVSIADPSLQSLTNPGAETSA